MCNVLYWLGQDKFLSWLILPSRSVRVQKATVSQESNDSLRRKGFTGGSGVYTRILKRTPQGSETAQSSSLKKYVQCVSPMCTVMRFYHFSSPSTKQLLHRFRLPVYFHGVNIYSKWIRNTLCASCLYT